MLVITKHPLIRKCINSQKLHSSITYEWIATSARAGTDGQRWWGSW